MNINYKYKYSSLDCANVTDILNGKVIYPNGTTLNELAFYTCDDGYEIVGADTRVCHATGDWSPDAPTCEGSECF